MTAHNTCPLCGDWKDYKSRQCMACRRAAALRPCLRCGDVGHLTRERCWSCYLYRRRTGQERPAYLWDGTPQRLPCRDCGQPSQNRYRRWCRACHQRDWRARQKAARPAERSA